jgi:hypothetical protein
MVAVLMSWRMGRLLNWRFCGTELQFLGAGEMRWDTDDATNAGLAT